MLTINKAAETVAHILVVCKNPHSIRHDLFGVTLVLTVTLPWIATPIFAITTRKKVSVGCQVTVTKKRYENGDLAKTLTLTDDRALSRYIRMWRDQQMEE